MQAVFLPLVTMAVADVSRDFLNGTAVNAGRSILNSFSKGTVFVIAAIINMVLTFVGTMFFIIPGLIVTVWLYFFDYAIIYDDAGSIESLKQSKKLVKGQFFKIAVYILFINLVSSILSNIVYYIFGGISMFFAGEVLVRTLTDIPCLRGFSFLP